MKTAIITCAILSLSLSFSEACGSKRSYKKPAPAKKSYTPKKTYTPKKKTYSSSSSKKSTSYSSSRKRSSYRPKHNEPSRPTINIGSESMNPREGFLRRLNVAPKGRDFGSSIINASTHSLSGSAYSAANVRMLGKIEYEWGKSTLSYDSKHAVESAVLNAIAAHGSHCQFVVFGFADKTGRSSVNFRLSDVRANAVKEHIDHLSWSRGLHLDTAAVAMGEEIELCRHNFGHNRVAEIWMIEYPRPVQVPTVAVTETIAPVQVIETTTAVAPAPAPIQVQPAPAPVTNVIEVPATTTVAPAVAPVDPLAGLIEFLRNNTVVTGNADPNELAQRLAAVQAMQR